MAEAGLIQDRYRLLERIGRGGMGEVWRARDESLGRSVAVKCLKPVLPERDRQMSMLRERFRREARVAAGLQHPGITVVHDFGEHDGVLYLVMELLHGENLSQLLSSQDKEPIPVGELLAMAAQIASALAYTHTQGIVHRDLKPANVMRLSDGTIKICDFGIARLAHDIGFTKQITGSAMAMGTPHYMSPEQIAGGEDVDHRSDLYSFGCVLYELATGSPPFDRGDAWAVLLQHRDAEPEPPRIRRPDLPDELQGLVLDLLAKNAEERPADASEVGGRLAEISAVPGRATMGSVSVKRLPVWARGLVSAGPSLGVIRRSGFAWDEHLLSFAMRWSSDDASYPMAGGEYFVSPARPVVSRYWQPYLGGSSSAELTAVLAKQHSAALSLSRLGRWEEACETHRAVADARSRVLGPDHQDTLASRYEVAFSLGRLERFEESLAEYVAVADARTQTLGPDHLDTLAARQETGFVLGRLGRYGEAHEIYVTVLEARTRTAGAEHPDTMRCRHNLAFNLGKLGRYEESHRIAAEVAMTRARVLGPRHVDTLATRYEVGYALGQLHRWEEAIRVYREVATARDEVVGAEHPDTLAARYEVGICLGRLHRTAEALELYQDLVAIRTRVYGTNHPETLRARHGAGVNLGRLGRWEQALEEARDVAAIRDRVLGRGHPDTLVSRREVAVSLGWLGRWAKALEIYREVAQAREQTLGPAHPDTLASRNDEAHCLEQLGRSEEALELYRKIADVQNIQSAVGLRARRRPEQRRRPISRRGQETREKRPEPPS